MTMRRMELIMPKMGESIMEATILRWLKKEGDYVEADETLLEIATDKVDSEVPSPASGTVSKLFFNENDTVEIGKVIAWIETEPGDPSEQPTQAMEQPESNGKQQNLKEPEKVLTAEVIATEEFSGRFYSPLVKNIAKQENISFAELESIEGSGQHGRVTKKDILAYIDNKSTVAAPPVEQPVVARAASSDGRVEIIEMDRMRRLIADHMVHSKHTSAHVTSFVEADVTNIVQWREKNKTAFESKFGEKITFTPIFIEAIIKAIVDFPLINSSVEGNNILVKKDINIGMAAALPSGNLIVPVIKNADHLSLVGLTKVVNDFANRARSNKLKADEIQGGTFTLTNVGTFGNVMGTPIINQPQVAILATGAIRKKPAVVETEYGDVIAIRQLMFLSLSYDHRIVDGYLGGSFLRRIADYLEGFDVKRPI